jgi:hypothetical protein
MSVWRRKPAISREWILEQDRILMALRLLTKCHVEDSLFVWSDCSRVILCINPSSLKYLMNLLRIF